MNPEPAAPGEQFIPDNMHRAEPSAQPTPLLSARFKWGALAATLGAIIALWGAGLFGHASAWAGYEKGKVALAKLYPGTQIDQPVQWRNEPPWTESPDSMICYYVIRPPGQPVINVRAYLQTMGRWWTVERHIAEQVKWEYIAIKQAEVEARQSSDALYYYALNDGRIYGMDHLIKTMTRLGWALDDRKVEGELLFKRQEGEGPATHWGLSSAVGRSLPRRPN